LALTPGVGVADVTRERQPIFTQAGSAGYTWQSKRLVLSLRLTGSLARQTYLAFAGLAPNPADVGGQGMTGTMPGAGPGMTGTAPTGGAAGQGMQPANQVATPYLVRAQVVRVYTVTGSVGLAYLLSRRWNAGIGLAYSIGGGLGHSEGQIPKHYGPSASASAGYKLSSRDTLTTSLSSSYTKVPTLGSRFISSTLLESWGHVLGKRTQSNLALGVSHLRSRATPQSDYDDSFFAAGNASLTHSRPLHGGATLGFTAATTLGLSYNPLLGVVQQQLTEVAAVGWQKDKTSLGASVTGAQSLPQSSPAATRSLGFGVFGGYAIAPAVSLRVGGSWTTQILPADAGGSYPAQWTAFAGLSLAAPPITLF